MAPSPVQAHVLLTSVEEMAPKKAQPAKSAKEPVSEGDQPKAPKEPKRQAPKEAAKEAKPQAPEEAATPEEAEPQAPEEAAEQPAAAAPEEAAEQPATAAPGEAAEQPAAAAAGEVAQQPTAAAPGEVAEQPAAAAEAKEAKPQAPKEAAKEAKPQAPKEATKEAKPQAPKEAAEEAKPQAPVGGAKEAKRQAPKEAAKEAKPQATKKAKEKEQWLRPGVTIPGYKADTDDSSSGGHSATLSAVEIAEMTDVELEAYKTAGPPPTDVGEWDVPKDAGIAPIGRSWQDRQWRRRYREQYRKGAANVARGMVDENGNPARFHVTTDTTPTAYYFIEGQKTT